MGKIYAKAVIKGDRTLASIPDMWFDATFTATVALATEDRLEQILTQAAADGVIIPDGYVDAGTDVA